MCNREKIKHENKIADSPQFNGIAERALRIIEAAGLAAKIQASELYPDERIPTDDRSWAEQVY